MLAQPVLVPALGRETLGRATASRQWLSTVSPSSQLLGTAFGFNVISQGVYAQDLCLQDSLL